MIDHATKCRLDKILGTQAEVTSMRKQMVRMTSPDILTQGHKKNMRQKVIELEGQVIYELAKLLAENSSLLKELNKRIG